MPSPTPSSNDDLSDLAVPSAPANAAAPVGASNKTDVNPNDDLSDLSVPITPLGKEAQYEQGGALHKAAGTAEALISAFGENAGNEAGYNLIHTDSDDIDAASQELHPTAATIGHVVGDIARVPVDAALATGAGKILKPVGAMLSTAVKTIPQTAVSLLTLGGVGYGLDKFGNLIYPGLGDKLHDLTSNVAIIPQAARKRPLQRGTTAADLTPQQRRDRLQIIDTAHQTLRQKYSAGLSEGNGLEDVRPSQEQETVPYGSPDLETAPISDGIESDYGSGGNLSDFTQ